MKKIIFLLLFIPYHLFAQDSSLEKFIDSLMAPVNRSDMPESLLIIAKDGKPLIRKAYGMANLEMQVPASPDHLFALASVNKQMIAVCILQLAQQGKLKLTDDIRKYLPHFNTHGRVVIVEQLLNHTSGIYSGNSPARGKSLYDLSLSAGMLSDQEFLNFTMQQPMVFEPGTDWTQNTFAYHLALFVIEKASGLPFNEYVRNYLFLPAGMSNSFSKVDANRLGFNGIKNYNSSFYSFDVDGKWIWRDTRRLTPYFLYQRYSIITCLDDLVKWDVALREGKLLSAEWLQKAWTAGFLKDGRSTCFGLGWELSEINGYKIMAGIGIGTNPICVVHIPQEKLYIAYTQFFGTFDQAEMRVKKILSQLLPLPYPAPAKAEAPLTDYAGVYQVHRTGFDIASQIAALPIYLNVTVTNDTLYLQQTAGEKFALRPAGKDRFLPITSENTWYIFSRNENGKVDAIGTRGSFWSYGPEVQNKKVNKVWPQPVMPKAAPIDQLKHYVGIYYYAPFDAYVVIETDDVKLFNKVQGRQQELMPVANNKFVRKGVEDVSYEFKATADGAFGLTVTGLRAIEYKKLNYMP